MHIIPKDFTLHSLLLNPNEQFVVPSYQRRYAWKYNQWAALFEDIDMLLPNDGHLFGMLILPNLKYILDLLLSIINVSLQTVEIVEGLPEADFET